MFKQTLTAAALATLPCTTAFAAADDHAHHQQHSMSMTGALGDYAMTREASGTSWQPEASTMAGRHFSAGGWMLMLHGYVDVVYDRQGGPRGDEKTFAPSMLMLMGQRPLGAGTWTVRGMASLDPLMGRRGYPLLLQTGETADGEQPLVDRQHPHDLFMELSTSYSLPVGSEGSVFGYVGLPGEPALGPPAFMHRDSGLQLPEAPLTHHWLDSTHITFGVITLGATWGDWKLEGSAFNGREPDQSRWNIETRRLDSYSGRLSVNPSEAWSAQVSYGYLPSSEQLEPEMALHRLSASVSTVQNLDDGGQWSTTAGVGINRSHRSDHPAYLLESARRFDGPLSLFGRAEYLYNEHLFDHDSPLAGEHAVGKLSLGGSWRLGETEGFAFDLGALLSGYLIPREIETEYGERPLSGMVFLRTSIE